MCLENRNPDRLCIFLATTADAEALAAGIETTTAPESLAFGAAATALAEER